MVQLIVRLTVSRMVSGSIRGSGYIFVCVCAYEYDAVWCVGVCELYKGVG